jgi:hypothetical protein
VAVLRLVPGATPLVRAEALAEFDERLENVAVRKLLGRELIVAHIPTKGTGGGEQEGDTQIWEAQGAAFVSILRFTSDGEDSIGAYLKKGTRIGKDGCLWQGIFSSELAEAAGALEVRVTTNWEWGPPNGLGPPCRVKRPPQSRRYVDRYVFKGDKLVAKGPLHRGHPLKDDRPR